jgi:glycosyltransferase involved in cell wall biosynthesis
VSEHGRVSGRAASRPTIAVLVNGEREGALGVRARGLFEPLSARYDLHYFYRDGGKVGSARSFFRSVSRLRPALVYVLDTAVSGAAAATVARLVRGTRFLVDTGDLGYELAELKGKPGWLARQVIRAAEASALRLADAVVVRGTYHKRILEEAGISPVHVIRDGIDVEARGGPGAGDLRKELGLDDCLSVGMIGSLRWNPRYRMCYGWDVVEAMGLLGPDPRVAALVVGDGEGRPYLQRRASELGVGERIRFVGRVPYAQLGAYLGAIDVAISTQTNNRVGQVRTTGKLPAYMASGCYVIASDVGEARLLLPAEMRLPYEGVKDEGYPRRLAKKIAELAGWDRAALREATRETVGRARAELDYAHLSSLLETVLDSTLEQRGRVGPGSGSIASASGGEG